MKLKQDRSASMAAQSRDIMSRIRDFCKDFNKHHFLRRPKFPATVRRILGLCPTCKVPAAAAGMIGVFRSPIFIVSSQLPFLRISRGAPPNFYFNISEKILANVSILI